MNKINPNYYKKVVYKLKFILIVLIKIVKFFSLIILAYFGLLYILKNISIELSNVILNYLTTLIWPFIVIIIVYFFKSNFAQLLDRIVEWDIFGIKGKTTETLDDQQDPNINDTRPDNEDFELAIKNKEDEISSLEETTKELINKLSIAEVELDFERIFNFIFKSQIELLNQINLLGGKVAFSYVVEHFEKIQKNFPSLVEWDTTKYLQFLVNSQLVEYITPGSGNFITVIITSKGKAFINYVTSKNYQKYDF